MQYALFTKIGGELIEASHADYQDYYGFLKCPVCNEPVFLRKSHLRNGKEIQASFAHHKAVPEISTCELRVGKYSTEDIESFASKAKNQRLQKLNISMWKYIKTNIALNLTYYENFRKITKDHKQFQGFLDYGDSCLLNNHDLIIKKLIPRFGQMLKNQDAQIGIAPGYLKKFNIFMDELKSDWLLHQKIAQEAAEVFLSPQMQEIRYRLLLVLCYPPNMELLNKDLVELNPFSNEWKLIFVKYLTHEIVFIFLSINWIKLLS